VRSKLSLELGLVDTIPFIFEPTRVGVLIQQSAQASVIRRNNIILFEHRLRRSYRMLCTTDFLQRLDKGPVRNPGAGAVRSPTLPKMVRG